jgi:4-hydroxy-4-methyl-2-oxoglutarate aldolase
LTDAIPPTETIVSELYAAVLSDVMDDLGLVNRAMKPFVRPLVDGGVMFGRARTGIYAPVYARREGSNPYELEIKLVDDLKPGEVAVLGCNGPTDRIAPWGELLSTAATYRGAAGCVTDGLVRDIKHIRKIGFPVYHGGIAPLNSAGRAEIVSIDEPTECGGVLVRSGDYVFGDEDGVVVIPQERAAEVFTIALRQVKSESNTRTELQNGLTLRQVYDKYGVL